MCECMSMCVRVCACVHTRRCVCVCVCACTCRCVCVFVCVCACATPCRLLLECLYRYTSPNTIRTKFYIICTMYDNFECCKMIFFTKRFCPEFSESGGAKIFGQKRKRGGGRNIKQSSNQIYQIIK